MKKNSRIKKIISLSLAAALVLFTLYVALDTFVIPRAYAQAEPSVQSAGAAASIHAASDTEATAPAGTDETDATESETTPAYAEPEITDTSYKDANISINIETYYEYGTYIYVADVRASSAEYLKAAFAYDTYGRNITDVTSSIAADNGAILAVNGDFYGSQERGYVIRNGILYRENGKSEQEDLVIYRDGTFEIVNEDDITAEELLENGAWQVLSFGPGIVSDGEITVSENEEVDKAMRSNPRTAIGYIDENHYVLVVSDGRTAESEGLSLYELAEFMQSIGVTEGYNLDGGGSSTMYFNGYVVNNPTSSGNRIKERDVSDIIYF